jgi:DNA ligase D
MARAESETLFLDGHEVTISNPGKVFFADAGITKMDLVNYYLAVADGAVLGVRDRPMALKRFVDGAAGQAFFQKRAPKSVPSFVRTVELSFPSGRTADEVVVDNTAALAWVVNLGCIDLNPHPVRAEDLDHPDELRIDLDPQPGTTFTDAVRVAGVAREVLEELGIRGYPKTSGNRGIHIYVRIETQWTFEDVRHAAIGFGRELERRDKGVTTAWWKEERGERIFVDYNQNNRDRTIASAYSLRPIPGAPVSTPMSWDEIAGVADPREYNLFTVPDRVSDGDPWATIDDEAFSLEPLLQLWEELPGGELNFPPDYPKMPGEPPRVQPSKKVAEHWDDEGNWIGGDRK